jgi:hypothetical protein
MRKILDTTACVARDNVANGWISHSKTLRLYLDWCNADSRCNARSRNTLKRCDTLLTHAPEEDILGSAEFCDLAQVPRVKLLPNSLTLSSSCAGAANLTRSRRDR